MCACGKVLKIFIFIFLSHAISSNKLQFAVLMGCDWIGSGAENSQQSICRGCSGAFYLLLTKTQP